MFPKARRAIWLLTSCGILSLCAFAIVRNHSSQDAQPYEMSSIPKQSHLHVLPTGASVLRQNQASLDVILISLMPTGFEPSEVTHPAGKFLFGVNNRTGLSDLTFQLTDEAGRPLGEKQMVKERTWRKIIEPKPGRYLLRVVGHPSWLCQVIITP